MTTVKRHLAVLTLLSLLVSVSGLAAAFPDVSGTRFQDSANYLKGLGVLVGDPDGNFYPTRSITRAEAAKIIVSIVGKSDQVAAMQNIPAFPDTAGHWGNGYIAVAKSLEIIHGFPDGTFKPDVPVTYVQMAKMLLEASGRGPTEGLEWPENYMTAAAARNILTGIPSHPADDHALRGDCAIMTARTVQQVTHPTTGLTLAQSVFGAVASLEIVPTAASTPAGAAVQITAIPKDALGQPITGLTIAYETSDRTNSSVSQTGQFNSPVPGVYTVTATVAGLSETATITVYGASTALRATPSQTQVSATGVSKVTITVEVVDALGNRVANNHTAQVTMAYAAGGNNGAVTLGPTVKTVSGGVVVFEVTSTANEDRQDTLAFSATGLTAAQVSLTTVAQVADRITVTADPEAVRSNAVMHSLVTATVLDQSGQPMAAGVVNVTFTISGPGSFAGGVTTPQSTTTSTGKANIDVYSVQGTTGDIVVTASAENLTSGQVTIPAYLAGAPVGLRANVTDNTITAGDVGPDADTAKLRVELIDGNGMPTTQATPVTFEIALANGDDLSTVGLLVSGGITIPAGQTRSGEITISAAGADKGLAGVHTLKVFTAPTLTAPTFTVLVVPGAASALKVAPVGSVSLSISNPSAVVTVQLVDAAHNQVATIGVEVRAGWSVPVPPNQGKPTINGILNPPNDPAAAGAVVALTDSTGKATFNFAAQGYLADSYVLHFRAGALVASTGTISIVNLVPGSIPISFKSETGATITRVRANYSEVGWLWLTVNDENGNPMGNWEVELQFPDKGANIKNPSVEVGTVIQPYANGRVVVRSFNSPGDPDHGRIALMFQGAKSGNYVVTATARGLATPATGSASFQTAVGTTVAAVIVTTAAGGKTTGLDVTANVAIQLQLATVDFGGNRIVSNADVKVLIHEFEGLYTTGANGEFRLAADGVALSQGAYVIISRGVSTKSVWYIQPLTQTIDIGLDNSVSAYTAYQLEVVDVNAQPGPPATNIVTLKVTDASGNLVAGVKAQASVEAGTLASATATSDSSGLLQFTWTGGHLLHEITVTLADAVLGDGASRVEVTWLWTPVGV